MSRPQPATTATKTVYFDTPNLYVRTMTERDATDRWTAWFDQDAVLEGLNLSRRTRTKADMIAYINGFDQTSRLLLGIFDRTNDLLIGILTVDIDWGIGRYLANTVVGEADYRHRGVMLEISQRFRRCFFEEMKLKVMTAAVLATNRPIIAYLEKTGWTLAQTVKNHARSIADGKPVDLLLYSLTRESWNAWMAANPDELRAMAQGRLHK